MGASPGGSCAVILAILAATVVGTWHVSAPFVERGLYVQAILATGGIFVLGFNLTNFVLRLIHWAEETDRADAATQ